MTNIQIHVKHQINEYQCKRHKHFQGHTKDIRTGLSFQSVLELGPELPLFGVCMGLQCIGEAYGVGSSFWYASNEAPSSSKYCKMVKKKFCLNDASPSEQVAKVNFFFLYWNIVGANCPSINAHHFIV
ncbi:uncharacterized protein LOC110007725 isoform X3 [Amborella trichopoda]|nr:uncharacterized protein LOC110007725 isoform X3 [Amborella trichopoda]|eukprot:XP_020526150.1 uncharacterized protein LOC110007725 isoform X3 [Amborella trichopoda]